MHVRNTLNHLWLGYLYQVLLTIVFSILGSHLVLLFKKKKNNFLVLAIMTMIIITSKCVAASVCLLNQHCESSSSSENYKYFTCSVLFVRHITVLVMAADIAVLLCFAWLTEHFCLLFHFPSPEQHSQTQGKPLPRLWWCWWLMRSWVFIPFSFSYFFSCRAAFHFRRLSLIIIISDRLSGVLNLSESCQARFVTLPCWKMMLKPASKYLFLHRWSKLEIDGH